jgi:CRP/FNR family cyclic AMP-dependent transcriptional regulator
MEGRSLVKPHALGKLYSDGECILFQGDPSEYLYIVQEGKVEIAYDEADRATRLVLLEEGELFGESALFDQGPRTANVRAVGNARVLTLDRQVLLRRIQENPLVALELLRSMSRRLEGLTEVVKHLRGEEKESAPSPDLAES